LALQLASSGYISVKFNKFISSSYFLFAKIIIPGEILSIHKNQLVMKQILLSIVLMSSISLSAQTSSQRSLINDFFRRGDVQKVIQVMGHPTPTHRGVTLSSISDNVVYLNAAYQDFWVGSFSCEYRLKMRGKPLDRFSVRELLCCALFTIWYDNGYYGRY
jgi:hypothetical protein